jgi:HEAT repeat protein
VKKFIIIFVALGLAALFIIQQRALNAMREEMLALRKQVSEMEETASRRQRPSASASSTLLTREAVRMAPPEPGAAASPLLDGRLAALEFSVGELVKNSRYLMDRGQLPPDAEYVAQMKAKFLDPATSDRDRLQALRVLRRGDAMDDHALQFTANWLQTLADERTREGLLGALEGMTNAVLKTSFLQLAMQSQDGRVRGQAVENLRVFSDDPQVEALLWDKLRNDPDRRVRDEAGQALREGPMTAARAATFKQIALNPQLPIDERLFAISALRAGRVDAPEVNATIAQLAQSGQDQGLRMRIFQAFDGTTDKAFAAPFVQGLQDPNPEIRRLAADSLSGLKADPNVAQWLQYVAQNDTDPRVRREAQEALQAQR